jgi:uncharacterized repeat protein (TIGR02543 family)
MAFPGTLNINYYKGDTYEFRIYPKNSDGSIFDLSTYGNATFTIAKVRGTAGLADQITAHAEIASNGTYVLCAIAPNHGVNLDQGTTYVYDVQVRKSSVPYEKIYTLLNGSITVTEDVTIGVGNSDYNNTKYRIVYIDLANTGGTIPRDTNFYIPGQTVTIATNTLTRPGYTFLGWNTDPEGGSMTRLVSGSSTTMGSADLVLYSEWATI